LSSLPAAIASACKDAKLKALLRKPAARTVESLWHALADLLDRFTPQECANYLANAEYAPLNRNQL
jgi:hypothetical protein